MVQAFQNARRCLYWVENGPNQSFSNRTTSLLLPPQPQLRGGLPSARNANSPIFLKRDWMSFKHDLATTHAMNLCDSRAEGQTAAHPQQRAPRTRPVPGAAVGVPCGCHHNAPLYCASHQLFVKPIAVSSPDCEPHPHRSSSPPRNPQRCEPSSSKPSCSHRAGFRPVHSLPLLPARTGQPRTQRCASLGFLHEVQHRQHFTLYSASDCHQPHSTGTETLL